jgi:hypothetical protein
MLVAENVDSIFNLSSGVKCIDDSTMPFSGDIDPTLGKDFVRWGEKDIQKIFSCLFLSPILWRVEKRRTFLSKFKNGGSRSLL